MNWSESIKNVVSSMRYSVSRFPLTVLFLVLVAILNSMVIEDTDLDFTRLILTFLVGAFLSVVAQMIYERFFIDVTRRYALMAAAVLLTVGYYFAAGPQSEFDIVVTIKTFVALFALFIAFIWIPSINNEAVPFYRSFLSAIKSLFTAGLFTLVLTLGIWAIFSATNYLLFEVDTELFGHFLNIVATLFGPIYFLSMTPLFPGEKEQYSTSKEDKEQKQRLHDQFTVPRFLEVLISYIIIPLIGIYTLILVLYVVFNITGDFWTDNLLEPLLVSYAVIVITVLILSYNLDNRFAAFFQKVFPKILVPIVVFQTIASILKIREMGITHGRYYVIMFGLFATVAGLVFSFMKPRHHGYVALVLLVLATISIIPPVDAFTVSRRSQIQFLEEKLVENDMLDNGEIVPNENLTTADRTAITRAATYLYEMGYTKEVAFLPEDFNAYENFDETFGFNPTYEEIGGEQGVGYFVYLNTDAEFVVDIENFDKMISVAVHYNYGETEDVFNPITFEANGESYQVDAELVGDYHTIVIRDETGEEVITFDTKTFFDDVFEDETGMEYLDGRLEVEEAIFTTENEQARLTVLIHSLESAPQYNFAEFNLFIEIKE